MYRLAVPRPGSEDTVVTDCLGTHSPSPSLPGFQAVIRLLLKATTYDDQSLSTPPPAGGETAAP
ncbi:hypothetical protein [Streptomyces sp. NPDC096030]|uniref:hypothetical protein n=1 Tax=Streptomyces sp. NPDC096030 TaxID=3155423 RepID=UPI003319704E